MSDAIMTSWQAQKIVVVSNSEEQDAWTEDTLLAQTLAHYAASSVIDLRGISKANLKNDAVYLLRNIWGDAGFEQARKNVYKVLDNAAVSYINQFTGKADQKGKFYLRDLFLAGYPTIPTFLSATQAFEHPAERFLLKPPFGASGIGIKTATRHDLRAELNNQILIIQPKLDFLHELSFFFIDAQFQYALITKSDQMGLGNLSSNRRRNCLGLPICVMESRAWNPKDGFFANHKPWIASAGNRRLVPLSFAF